MSESKQVKKLAKEMFEVCCFPDPTLYKNISQDEKDVWNYRASIILDKYIPKPSLLNNPVEWPSKFILKISNGTYNDGYQRGFNACHDAFTAVLKERGII